METNECKNEVEIFFVESYKKRLKLQRIVDGDYGRLQTKNKDGILAECKFYSIVDTENFKVAIWRNNIIEISVVDVDDIVIEDRENILLEYWINKADLSDVEKKLLRKKTRWVTETRVGRPNYSCLEIYFYESYNTKDWICFLEYALDGSGNIATHFSDKMI